MKFYPKDHKYIHEGISYPSASAIIEAYFGKFRKYDVADKYAKKHNIRKSKVLKDWADKAKKATTIGTLIHEYAETQVSGENHEYMAKTTREKEIIQDNKDKIEELKKKTDSVIKKIKKKFPDYEYTTEMIIYSEKLKLAGTAELVLKKEEKVVFRILRNNLRRFLLWRVQFLMCLCILLCNQRSKIRLLFLLMQGRTNLNKSSMLVLQSHH